MEQYKNLTHQSGVKSYQIEKDAIIIEFTDGTTYLYNDKATGHRHIQQMKKLALDGHGLCTYINQNVRKNYARRLS
jgi:hypothetical protein